MRARGLCSSHYSQLVYGKGPIGPIISYRGTPEQRFWEKVEKTDTCWLWKGALDARRYGRFNYNGLTQAAHRVVLLLQGVELGSSHVDHLCRVHVCVNPAHLELVSNAENMRRSLPYRTWPRAEFCYKGHPITTAPGGYRWCYTCRQEGKKTPSAHARNKERRERAKAEGLCQQCCKEPAKGYRCQRCADKHAACEARRAIKNSL